MPEAYIYIAVIRVFQGPDVLAQCCPLDAGTFLLVFEVRVVSIFPSLHFYLVVGSWQ